MATRRDQQPRGGGADPSSCCRRLPLSALGVALVLLPTPLSAQDRDIGGSAGPADIVEARKVALVIGNGAYQSVGRLGQAPEDARLSTDEGVYAQSLARYLEQPGVELTDLFRRLHADVETRSQRRQGPWHTESRSPGRLFSAGLPVTVPQQPSKLGYELVRIPAGSFTMGSPSSEEGRDPDETQHTVRLTRDLWLGKTEVTQGLWEAVMGDNPSACDYRGLNQCDADYPVQSVSWVDAVTFANALSVREGLESCYRISGDDVTWPKGQSCTGYRLPTEAEWEYAARAGEHGLYAGAESTTAACRIANVNTQHSTSKFGFYWDAFPCEDKHLALAPVGSYGANAWGLHDMTGNVWEWTWDVYGAYPSGSVTDPTGASADASRVNRGGGWSYTPASARLANRSKDAPGERLELIGLRLARSI